MYPKTFKHFYLNMKALVVKFFQIILVSTASHGLSNKDANF